MKQVFFKTAILVLAITVVSAVVAANTNACDKELVPNTFSHKKSKPKKISASGDNAIYTDFILTNSILRF
jgi:hypothetical protein